MTNPIMVQMPLQLTPELIKAVQEHPMTKCETSHEWHAKLGWLICAYGVMVEAQTGVNTGAGTNE